MEIKTNKYRQPSMEEIMWKHYERTLRDDFAKAALEALITAKIGGDEQAKIAYTYADRMLEARKQKP